MSEVTDQRIAIVREWAAGSLALDLREDIAARLIAKLDAARPEPGVDVVERAARALHRAQHYATPWEELAESTRFQLRSEARAALSAVHPPDALALAIDIRAALDAVALPEFNGLKLAHENARALVRLLESAGGGK